MNALDNIPGWPSDSDWTQRLAHHFTTSSFQQLMTFVAAERQTKTVFPPADQVFTAFALTPFGSTKVIILGQDPYHGAGQAHGLSFSVPVGIKPPPSLRNILKELKEDLGADQRIENKSRPARDSGSSSDSGDSGDLTAWARQGVLLLNTVLTVNEAAANSHRKQGWEDFTDEVIRALNDHSERLVFILWGKPAEKKTRWIDDRHAIITSAHPSPLSAHRGFFGSRPFSRTNQLLEEFGHQPIEWHLND